MIEHTSYGLEGLFDKFNVLSHGTWLEVYNQSQEIA